MTKASRDIVTVTCTFVRKIAYVNDPLSSIYINIFAQMRATARVALLSALNLTTWALFKVVKVSRDTLTVTCTFVRKIANVNDPLNSIYINFFAQMHITARVGLL